MKDGAQIQERDALTFKSGKKFEYVVEGKNRISVDVHRAHFADVVAPMWFREQARAKTNIRQAIVSRPAGELLRIPPDVANATIDMQECSNSWPQLDADSPQESDRLLLYKRAKEPLIEATAKKVRDTIKLVASSNAVSPGWKRQSWRPVN